MRMLKQRDCNPRRLWLASLVGLPLALGGCSDDTFIATNENPDLEAGAADASDGSSGSGGSSSGGTSSGGSSSGGASGSASGGTAGTAGSGGCTPGQTRDNGSCEMCGTKQQTCDQNGAWGAEQCVNQGVCKPGDEDTSACSDPCGAKKCKNDCTWGACGLKSGAKCLHESGSNFQCCGTDMWQFCSGTACDWFPCASCGGSSSCQNAC